MACGPLLLAREGFGYETRRHRDRRETPRWSSLRAGSPKWPSAAPASRQRQPHDDLGPTSHPRTPNTDAPAVLLHDALADGQTQARSLPHLLGGEEGIEHLAEMLRGDTDPRIGHDHVDPFGGTVNRSIGRGVDSSRVFSQLTARQIDELPAEARRAVTVMSPPPSTASRALVRRFRKTWWSIWASPCTTGPVADGAPDGSAGWPGGPAAPRRPPPRVGPAPGPRGRRLAPAGGRNPGGVGRSPPHGATSPWIIPRYSRQSPNR